MEIAAVTAAVGVIVWVVLWHLFLSMNRLSISTTFGRLLSFLEIVAIARVVVVDVGLIPTTGPPAVVTRVTKTILLIVIHEVSFENGGGVDGARRGDLKGQGGVSNNSCVCLLVVYRVYYGFDLDQEFPKNPNAPLTYTILTQVSYLVSQTHHQTSFS